ncbi:MAG: MEDS domain-containing protein [Chloroflexi bacterium]|nr:MEDS domain-containing protein [Chloroflexota bacterium]
MNNPRQPIELGFTEEVLPESCHMCFIYDDEAQRQKIVSEYLAAGLKHGELVRYAADMTSSEEIHSWLLQLGIAPPQDDSFSVFKAESFYCPNGQFDPGKMIAGMLPRYAQLKKAGYKGIRSCGEMTWALRGIPGSNRLLEYEALLSTVTGDFPHTGMCLYDAKHFDGITLFQVLQVHPYMIAQGQIVRNPFYLKPEEFLAESKRNA